MGSAVREAELPTIAVWGEQWHSGREEFWSGEAYYHGRMKNTGPGSVRGGADHHGK